MSKKTPTPAQQKILDKMEPGKTYCAYDLGVSLSSLNALVSKGYLASHREIGAIAFPRISILYIKKNNELPNEHPCRR